MRLQLAEVANTDENDVDGILHPFGPIPSIVTSPIRGHNINQAEEDEILQLDNFMAQNQTS